ncbi:MAG: zinc-dependent alcohol dehydrogenase [Chthonomonadales bacterium]
MKDGWSIVFTGRNQVEVIREPTPEPGPGEVLLEARCTLISTGTEGIILSRLYDPGTHWDRWVRYPFHPGYSFVGRVVAVGSEVKGFHPGDRVAARANHRQFTVISAESLYPVPAGIADEDAAWFGLANIVQIAVRRAEHSLGDAVVVVGLGLLGQLVVQYARLMGARMVVAVDTADLRLEMARRHGATHTLPMDAASAVDEVHRLTGGGGDVVYDVTGHADVFPHCLRMARRLGKVVLLGDTGSPAKQCLTPDVVTRGLRIIGSHDSNAPQTGADPTVWDHHRMADLFFDYVQRGDMRVSDLVTHRYAPHEAPEAYAMLRERRSEALGVIFDWTRI